MKDPATARRIARIVTAACMLAGPVILLAGTLVHPANKRNEVQQFAIAAHHPNEWIVGHILNFTALMLLLGAFAGLAYLLHDREPVLAVVGGGLSVFGLASTVGYIAIHGFAEWKAATGGDPAQMAGLFDRVFSSPEVYVPFAVLPLAFGAGALLLAIGLFRSGILPAWTAGALALAPPLSGLGTPILLAINAFVIAGAALLIASLGWIGSRIAGWSDAEWHHPPSLVDRVGAPAEPSGERSRA